MSTPANLNRAKIRVIRSAAGIASGDGEYGLANLLWAYEGQLREAGRQMSPPTIELEDDDDAGQAS